MIYDEVLKFEKEMTDDRIPYERIEITDERLGYAIGWFCAEIDKRKKISNGSNLLQHTNRADILRKYIIKQWMGVNSEIKHEDKTMKKLLGYVTEGLMIREGEKLNSEIQSCILQGTTADIVKSVKRARQRAGLTQKEMSEQFEIPKRNIEDWDAGKSKPPKYAEKLIIEKLENMDN